MDQHRAPMWLMLLLPNMGHKCDLQFIMVVHLRLRMIPHVNWHAQINLTLIHDRVCVGCCIMCEKRLPLPLNAFSVFQLRRKDVIGLLKFD